MASKGTVFPALLFYRLASAPARGRLAGHFEFHRDGNIPTSLLQLVDAPYQCSVQFDVLEDDRSDVRPCNLGGPARSIECAILENEVGEGRIPAVDIDLPAVMLSRAVDKVEIVQGLLAARSGGIAPSCKVGRRKLNPNGELILGRNEVHVLETYVRGRWNRAISDLGTHQE